MKKKRILQAVILTVLFLLAVILGIIVFLPTPTTVEPRPREKSRLLLLN